MIGRKVLADGTDLGDEEFMTRDMGFDAAGEHEALELTEDQIIQKAERTAKEIETSDTKRAIRIYASLAKRFPLHADVEKWKQRR